MTKTYIFFRITIIDTNGKTSVDTRTEHFVRIRGLWNEFTYHCLHTINEMKIVGFTSIPRTDEDLENGTVLHHWSRKAFII